MKFAVVLCSVVSAAFSLAVECELDNPLDLSQKWKFLRGSDFFIQHQCSTERAEKISEAVSQFFESQKMIKNRSIKPVQIRLFSGAERYRQVMHFSRDRNAHFNARLNLIVAHCAANKISLEEPLNLYSLHTYPLRPWQRVFIAEVLPRLRHDAERNFFPDAKVETGVALQFLLLSNHIPAKAERATMRALATLLTEAGNMRKFIKLLLYNHKLDDTGIEALEKLFPEGVQHLESQLAAMYARKPQARKK